MASTLPLVLATVALAPTCTGTTTSTQPTTICETLKAPLDSTDVQYDTTLDVKPLQADASQQHSEESIFSDFGGLGVVDGQALLKLWAWTWTIC